MKANLEKLSDLERKLNFTIPSDLVSAKFLKAYQSIQRQAALPGFRKGKAPLDMIRKKYRESVMSDVANDIIKEAYIQALTEHALNPVSFPQISFDQLAEDQDFQFSATLEVQPEVTLNKVDGIKVKKEKLEVSDEQIADVLKNLQDSKVEHKDSEKDTLENGLIATINFEGFIGGEALAGGKGEDYPLEIGSNQFIPGFEEKLIGMKLGEERKITLQFPEDYHASDIAGKEVVFDVKLNKIQEKSVPELTDDFAKTIGDYESLEALKKNIRESIEKREQKRIDEDFRKRLLELVVENNQFEVPKAQVEEQKKLLLQDVKQRFEQQGMGEAELANYAEKWADDLDKTAKFMVQSGYVINHLAKENDVQVGDEDIRKKLEEYAAESGIDVAQLEEFYKQGDSRSRLSYQILEEKVVDQLAEAANVSEVSKDKLES